MSPLCSISPSGKNTVKVFFFFNMEVIQGFHILICISKTQLYLQGDYYIAYHIILFIGTNYTPYHQLIHCLYSIQINQRVTMKHVLNMWIPTKRYIISSYQCYVFELHVTHKADLYVPQTTG